jgi:predicted CoA-binding protein
MASLAASDPIRDLLARAKTIAVVGLSGSPLRPSHGVSAYMQTQGYKIIPVNPKIPEALGEKCYPSLLDVPYKIDIVNIFRRPEFVEEIVDQASGQQKKRARQGCLSRWTCAFSRNIRHGSAEERRLHAFTKITVASS